MAEEFRLVRRANMVRVPYVCKNCGPTDVARMCVTPEPFEEHPGICCNCFDDAYGADEGLSCGTGQPMNCEAAPQPVRTTRDRRA